MAKKSIEILVSDESYNSHNLRVMTAGGDFSRFEKNPIMLFNHIRAGAFGKTDDILPIGTWINFRIEGTRIFATPDFDLEDKFAKKLYGKFERGIIKSASIGIRILDMKEDGLDEQGMIQYIITKWQLMEISLVDIPSNENAIAFYNDQDEQIDLSAVIQQFAATKYKINLPMKYKNVPGLLGLSSQATDAEVEKSISDLLLLKTENEKLRLAAKTQRDADIMCIVDQAIADNKIQAGSKDQYIKLLNADFDATKLIIENMDVQIRLSDVPSAKITPAGSTDTAKFEGMTFREMQKKSPAKLAELKANDFTLFCQMYKADYGADYAK